MLDPNRIALTADAVGFRKRTHQAVEWTSFGIALQNQTDTIKTRREVAETPISVLHCMGGQGAGLESNEVLGTRARQMRQMNGYRIRSFTAQDGPIVPPKQHSDSVMALPMNIGIPQYVRYNAVAGEQYVSHFTEPLVAPLEHKETLMSLAGLQTFYNRGKNPGEYLKWNLNMNKSQEQINANEAIFTEQADVKRQKLQAGMKVNDSAFESGREKRMKVINNKHNEQAQQNSSVISKAAEKEAVKEVQNDLRKVDAEQVGFLGNGIIPILYETEDKANYEKKAARQAGIIRRNINVRNGKKSYPSAGVGNGFQPSSLAGSNTTVFQNGTSVQTLVLGGGMQGTFNNAQNANGNPTMQPIQKGNLFSVGSQVYSAARNVGRAAVSFSKVVNPSFVQGADGVQIVTDPFSIGSIITNAACEGTNDPKSCKIAATVLKHLAPASVNVGIQAVAAANIWATSRGYGSSQVTKFLSQNDNTTMAAFEEKQRRYNEKIEEIRRKDREARLRREKKQAEKQQIALRKQ